MWRLISVPVVDTISFCSQFRSEDFAGGLCCSYNDPRIITFDGTSFDTQALGQFYLVRTNVPGSPRLYEVTHNKILLINMEMDNDQVRFVTVMADP